ncbi:MAG: hydroxymethylglutaryl-CoA reductase [Bacteroidota bacterium]|nr:hydroxymethylglutaryl-CoA reductase [Bacteroidota bacterium]
MSTAEHKIKFFLEKLGKSANVPELIASIKNKSTDEHYDNEINFGRSLTDDCIEQRITKFENMSGHPFPYLTGHKNITDKTVFEGNIENYIGLTQVPTGIIGPVKVIGSAAQGSFYIPMATTEGALIASYQRGAKAASISGGITSVCLTEGVQRSPVFKFENMGVLAEFLMWIVQNMEVFKRITSETSNYAKLIEVRPNIEGNSLIITFEYETGDAAGQNMVTICTDMICDYIITNCPIKPIIWFIESNYSGDKKATAISFTTVRGKKVSAEVEIKREVVEKILRTTPDALVKYCNASTLGSIQSGAIGAQGHFSNGLAAIFMACGQDVACVSEAATGITRIETTAKGDLYACVTLPNLIVGTVGGATALPTQRECLEMMDCFGPGHSRKFAEIVAAVILAGELSITAAISAGHFVKAHRILGRKKSK